MFRCRGWFAALLMVPVATVLASCHLFHHTSAPTAAGREVIDGKFAFIVNDVAFSPTFADTHARGVWVIVSMAVRNVGAHPRPFEMSAQTLKDGDGRGHSASLMTPPSIDKVDPGLQMSIKLAFDVTPGVRPTQMVLRESSSSPGAPVNLKQLQSSSPHG